MIGSLVLSENDFQSFCKFLLSTAHPWQHTPSDEGPLAAAAKMPFGSLCRRALPNKAILNLLAMASDDFVKK